VGEIVQFRADDRAGLAAMLGLGDPQQPSMQRGQRGVAPHTGRTERASRVGGLDVDLATGAPAGPTVAETCDIIRGGHGPILGSATGRARKSNETPAAIGRQGVGSTLPAHRAPDGGPNRRPSR
jgi:hypothetical protein